MPKLKAIFFDFDETLAENIIPIQQLFKNMYAPFGDQLGRENESAFFTAFRSQAVDLWQSMFNIDTPPEQQFSDCIEISINSLGNHNTAEAKQISEAMFNHFLQISANNVRFNEGATETLASLKEAGFITGIITNGIEGLQLAKINQVKLTEQVDQVVVSAQARAHKPHAKVFQHALAIAGVSAEQAWQVGDHATNDVAGAIRAGMGGVFYNPARGELTDLFGELPENPTHVAHHLLDVVKFAQQD